MSEETIKSEEEFGNLNDNIKPILDNNTHIEIQKTSNNYANKIINENLLEIKDNNYNTVNDMPLLIDPENKNKGFYPNKIKIIQDKNSPLLKMQEQNKEKILNVLNECNDMNKTFDGYNRYPDLKVNSFSNVTGIGKSLMTPYISLPVPS